MTAQTPQFVQGRVTAVDERRYSVDVAIPGAVLTDVSYNPLAYIPRRGETVWVALIGSDAWVMGVASQAMHGSATIGRTPSAALYRDEHCLVSTGTQQLAPVDMDRKVWDTDTMLVDPHGDMLDFGAGASTTSITPRRTGLYTITAGGRWERNRTGRRGMDLRWADGETIARDEKAPTSEGYCAHSVSATIRITTGGSPTSAWVRNLGEAVEMVVWQTSGQDLKLLSDATLRPFLQMTYQGPNP